MAQSLTSKASLPIARSNDPVSIFAKKTRMSRKSAAATKDENVATTTAPVTKSLVATSFTSVRPTAS